jgi:outer membrane protein assembly factor BamB
MYRADAARTAQTEQSLAVPLALHWNHQVPHVPRPAWPRSRRMQFDRAFHVVVAGDRVLFGDSVDGTVTALDLANGEVVWKRFTGGPIRFAPAMWRDRAFVASDDGNLYALKTSDGSLLWQRRGGPGEKSVLGNEVMISKWPARGGPVVDDGVVYFAAGIWPSDGIYIYALDAKTGKTVWQNFDSGAIYMPQPHGGANANSGTSAQGYLVVSGDRLFVPTGRAVPAAFDRKTGEFQYFHLQKYGHHGEAFTMVVADVLFNGGIGFDVAGGHQLAKIGSGQLAASDAGVVRSFGTTLAEYVWKDEVRTDRKGQPETVKTMVPKWSSEEMPESAAIVRADRQVILGCDGRVCLFDPAIAKIVWEAPVDGVAYSLAVTEQALLVSTDRGAIYCFRPASLPVSSPDRGWSPDKTSSIDPSVGELAEQIVQRSGVTQGYCLDLGCGDGSLAYELAQRTQLRIVAVDRHPDNVRRARQRLSAAGLYGTRVVVQQRDLSATGFPRYFADLIVSQRSSTTKLDARFQQEAARLQRPFGGVICWGSPDDLRVSKRGALEGAGAWTHQYADPANTVNSGDSLIRGQLSMLWFRDVDFDIPSRHGRAPAPLLQEGRLFHEGMDGLVAVNAYNGRELWRYDIPDVLKAYDGDELMGVSGTNSNFCVGGDSVYVRHGHRCLRLDAANGTLLSEFATPIDERGERAVWGYVAWSDHVLFGTSADQDHIVTYRYLNRGGDMTKQLTESKNLFAIDTRSGDVLWRYDAENSIRHNALAVADGTVYLIDRPLALFDRQKKPESRVHPPGKLVALDARSGKPSWQNAEEIYGTTLSVSAKHGVVLMSYQPTRFRLASEVGGRMTALRADDGERIWDINADYHSRPTLNDRTVYAQGGAWDLLTGQPQPFEFGRSYGCGILACSQDMLVFRSATLGYYELSGAQQTQNYGGIRPGCWINAIPAGGIVLLPDATSGCECSYLNKAWIALEPTGVAQ